MSSHTKRKLLIHAYNTETKEFLMNMTSKEAGELINHTPSRMHGIITNRIMHNNWMFFDGLKYQSISAIVNALVLPPAVRRQATQEAKLKLQRDLELAHWHHYGKHKQILLLSETGDVVRTFDSYQNAADGLNIPIGTVRSKLYRATVSTSAPILCKREDYVMIRTKHF